MFGPGKTQNHASRNKKADFLTHLPYPSITRVCASGSTRDTTRAAPKAPSTFRAPRILGGSRLRPLGRRHSAGIQQVGDGGLGAEAQQTAGQDLASDPPSGARDGALRHAMTLEKKHSNLWRPFWESPGFISNIRYWAPAR